MRRAICIVALLVAAAFSGGCYVTQDAQGQWWACDQYQTANGPADACTPIQAPF